jgi:hypothetical protein
MLWSSKTHNIFPPVQAYSEQRIAARQRAKDILGHVYSSGRQWWASKTPEQQECIATAAGAVAAVAVLGGICWITSSNENDMDRERSRRARNGNYEENPSGTCDWGSLMKGMAAVGLTVASQLVNDEERDKAPTKQELQTKVAHLEDAVKAVRLYCPGRLFHLQRKYVAGQLDPLYPSNLTSNGQKQQGHVLHELLDGAQRFVLVGGQPDARPEFIALRKTWRLDHKLQNILVALESIVQQGTQSVYRC